MRTWSVSEPDGEPRCRITDVALWAIQMAVPRRRGWRASTGVGRSAQERVEPDLREPLFAVFRERNRPLRGAEL